MKYIHSALVLLLVLVFGIGMMPVAAAGATVTVGEATAYPGETVTLTVSATGFAEIAGIDLHLCYDTTRLECVTGRAVGLAATMAMADTNTAVSGHPDEVWFTAMTLDSVSGDGDPEAERLHPREAPHLGDESIELHALFLAVPGGRGRTGARPRLNEYVRELMVRADAIGKRPPPRRSTRALPGA